MIAVISRTEVFLAVSCEASAIVLEPNFPCREPHLMVAMTSSRTALTESERRGSIRVRALCFAAK